jgi:hypothetical protein
VNHVYLLLCVIDVVFSIILYACYFDIVLDMKCNLHNRLKEDKG